MKYPKEYLDEIKIRLKVSTVVSKHVSLKKRGKEFVGLSPLKKKLDKYRYIHGEDKTMKKQKPFVKKKSAVLSIPTAKIDPTPSALLAPIRSAEDLERERKFNQLVKEIEDEKKRIRNSGLGALI